MSQPMDLVAKCRRRRRFRPSPLAVVMLLPLVLSLDPVVAAPSDRELDGPADWEVERALAVLRAHLAAVGTVGAARTTAPEAQPEAAPTLGDASLSLDGQLHLGIDSAVFKDGETFLWDDAHVTGNLALGRGALGSAGAGGDDNTAIGQTSLASAIDSNANTAVGFSALAAIETSNNNAVGSRALVAATSGFRNNAAGSGALVLTEDGFHNTALGYAALSSNVSGDNNVAIGARALYSTNSIGNTALGADALFSNTTSRNTAAGSKALYANTTGQNLVAVGANALDVNDDDFANTAIGSGALGALTNGARNTALGANAGDTLINGSDNIFIGHDAAGPTTESHTIRIGTTGTFGVDRAFIAGIRDRTTANADAIPVMIDSAGQLGTASSSRTTKQDIRAVGDLSERLYQLRPVAFRYRHHLERNPDAAIQFGLIAEEVAEVFPELVIYDQDGWPETVKYHLLASLLLNEINKAEVRLAERRAELERSQAELESILSRPDSLNEQDH